MIKKKLFLVAIALVLLMGLTACNKTDEHKSVSTYANWDAVIKEGSGKTVTIFMWGGNESINQYMDGYVSSHLKDQYDITLKRVPMNAPEYLTKLINEKKGNITGGTGDLLWINAENFLTAKTGGLLDGPFTGLLPNQAEFYDQSASDLNYDSGITIEGFEAIWGRAQLVLTYDEAKVPNPPKSYEELMIWVKENPGKFTFPKVPEDFVGTAFVRNAYYELTGQKDVFLSEMSEVSFKSVSEPVISYFDELIPYLWNNGESFPASQAQQDELFKSGEILITMGFEVGKTAGLVASGVYPDTVKTYVFDSGSIGNSHYLAIPYNAPESAAALLTIDFLQSPEAQLEKMKAEVWGDMPAFDPLKADEEIRTMLIDIESVKGGITLETLATKRLPEMKSQYIDWIKSIWSNEIMKK